MKSTCGAKEACGPGFWPAGFPRRASWPQAVQREFDSLSSVPLHGASLLPASGSSPRPLSVAEPRRITRINTDAGDGVAYLLLPRLTLCLCFNAHFAGGLCRSARCAPRLRLCANRKCKRDCDDDAVRISASPVFLRLRARLTVNRCADEERREFLRCTGRNFDFVPHERESNSLAKKIQSLRKEAPNFFGIWPP